MAYDSIIKIGELQSALAALRAERDEMVNEKKARSAIDPTTRLHNLCDHLAEQRRESPYDQASWDAQDEAYREKCAELKRVEAERDAAYARGVEDAAKACDNWVDGRKFAAAIRALPIEKEGT